MFQLVLPALFLFSSPASPSQKEIDVFSFAAVVSQKCWESRLSPRDSRGAEQCKQLCSGSTRLSCSWLEGVVSLWHNPPMRTAAQVLSQLVVPTVCWNTRSIAPNQCRHPTALLIHAVFPQGGRSVLHLPHVLHRGLPKKRSLFSLWGRLGTCLMWIINCWDFPVEVQVLHSGLFDQQIVLVAKIFCHWPATMHLFIFECFSTPHK